MCMGWSERANASASARARERVCERDGARGKERASKQDTLKSVFISVYIENRKRAHTSVQMVDI